MDTPNDPCKFFKVTHPAGGGGGAAAGKDTDTATILLFRMAGDCRLQQRIGPPSFLLTFGVDVLEVWDHATPHTQFPRVLMPQQQRRRRRCRLGQWHHCSISDLLWPTPQARGTAL